MHRVVIVTGGTAGLGRAMVDALLEAGHRVVAVGSSGSSDLRESEQLMVVRGDVSVEADAAAIVERAVARFGTVDALVNNAGRNLPTAPKAENGVRARRFYDVTPDQWNAIVRTNVDGPFWMARALAPRLVAQGWGRIINHTTSYRTMVRSGEHPYGPSKAALEAMTTIWSGDLAEPA